MELSFWAATDVGRKREANEDNFLVDKKLSLFVVADGMGGHASGEVASDIAVHEFRNVVDAHRDLIERFAAGAPEVRPQDVLTLLDVANAALVDGLPHRVAELALIAAQEPLAVADRLVLPRQSPVDDLLEHVFSGCGSTVQLLLRTRRYHSQSRRTCFDV